MPHPFVNASQSSAEGQISKWKWKSGLYSFLGLCTVGTAYYFLKNNFPTFSLLTDLIGDKTPVVFQTGNSPVQLIGKVDDQILEIGEIFNLVINTNTLFQDVNGDFLNVTTVHVDDKGSMASIPSWLSIKKQVSTVINSDFGVPDHSLIRVANNTAYLSYYNGISVIDVSNVSNPVFLGNCTTASSGNFVIRNNTMYVANDYGLQIIDVTNQHSPALIGGYNTPGTANDVSILGNIAYVVYDDIVSPGFSSGLRIIDVTNPSATVYLGKYDTYPVGAEVVYVSGTTAYVGGQGPGTLYIINVSNPHSPVLLGTYPIYPNHLSLFGNYLYITASFSSIPLSIMDVSNPANPVIVSTLNLPGSTNDGRIFGTKAYLGGNLVDVSDPLWPIFIGKYDFPWYFYSFDISASIAYTTIYSGSGNAVPLQILDLTNTRLTFSGQAPGTGAHYTMRIMANDIAGHSCSAEFNVIVTRFPFLRKHLLLSISAGLVLAAGLMFVSWQGYRYRNILLQRLNLVNVTSLNAPLYKLNLIPSKELTWKKMIGKGGFGAVYSGTWAETDVAIKQLHIEVKEKGVLSALFNEVEIMAALKHPNVVGIYGISEDKEGELCLVMELMQGGALQNLLNSSEELSERFKVQTAIEIASGLKYLHKQPKPIMHRDIKSANVLLSQERHAKLTDFGLAKVKQEISNQPQENKGMIKEVVGTLPWMAPELFNAKPKYTIECDIYSYGMLLWEIYSRKIPFQNAPSKELLIAWKKESRQEQLPDMCPELIAKLIQSCCDKNPKTRPSLDSIIQQLLQYQKTLGLAANLTGSNQLDHTTTSTNNLLKDNIQSSFQSDIQHPVNQKQRVSSVPQGLFRAKASNTNEHLLEKGLRDNIDSEMVSVMSPN